MEIHLEKHITKQFFYVNMLACTSISLYGIALLQGCTFVQHDTVLNTEGDCNRAICMSNYIQYTQKKYSKKPPGNRNF